MEPVPKSSDAPPSLHDFLIRYYLCAKAQSPPISLKAEILRQVYLTLQFLPLFVSDSQYQQGLPWDFDTFWWLWNGLGIFTRLERTLRLLGLNQLIFIAGSCMLSGVRLLGMIILITECSLLTHAQFDTRLTREKYPILIRTLYKLDRVLRTITTYCLPIVLLSFYSSLAFCSDGICGDGVTQGVYRGIGAVSMGFTALVTLWDRTYLATLDWEENQLGSVASPWFSAVFAALDVSTTLTSISLPYSSHSVLNFSLLSVFSLTRLCAVYIYLPYHHLLANCFEAVRGLLVLWGVVLCVAGVSYDSGGLMPTLALLIITPMIVYFNALALEYLQYRYLHAKHVTSVMQLEHLMRGVLLDKLELKKKINGGREKTRKETSLEIRSPRIEALVEKFERDIASNTICLIWMLYFYRIQRDVVYIKVLRAQLCKQPRTLIDCVSILHCFYSLEKWLLELKDETEVVDFLSYQNDIEEVMECDYQATKMLRDLLEEMGKKHSSFTRTVQLSHHLSVWMNRALGTYRAILAAHPKSVDVLQLFISFLSLIGQPSLPYEKLLLKLEGGDSKRKSSKSLSMNEPGSVTFVISLENSDFGIIRWARSLELLGYRPGELIGSSHLELIPEPIRSNIHIQANTPPC